MTTISRYRQVGGVHPETAALANTLAALGVTAPHTGQPFTEAMLLGLGGGLGAGYILWEFKPHNAKVLVLGFRARWQYPIAYYQALCDRIAVGASFLETGQRSTADKQLRAAVERGVPAIAWVDRAHLPYLQLPEALKGHIGHLVAVCGLDDLQASSVDDLAQRPFRVAHETFADARARIGSYNNRLLLVEPPSQAIELRGAIMAGLRSCVEHLSQPSDLFSLPAIRKWAKRMTDTKNAKGWPVLFKDGRGLYGTLDLALRGRQAGEQRPWRAAWTVCRLSRRGRPRSWSSAALTVVAERIAPWLDKWSDLAEAALPDHVAPLNEARTLSSSGIAS